MFSLYLSTVGELDDAIFNYFVFVHFSNAAISQPGVVSHFYWIMGFISVIVYQGGDVAEFTDGNSGIPPSSLPVTPSLIENSSSAFKC